MRQNMKNETFDKEAMERVLSPEALDQYIRVTKPGAWLLIGALLLLVAAVFTWGVSGSLPETQTVNCALTDSGAVAYVDVQQFSDSIDGCEARIVTADGRALSAKVTGVSLNPLSQPEIAAAQSNDWLADMLAVSGYAYQVDISVDGLYTPGTLASATLITAEVKPITLLFRREVRIEGSLYEQ
jgi:hypothetical protein